MTFLCGTLLDLVTFRKYLSFGKEWALTEIWDEAQEGVLLAADTPKALVKPVKCAEAFEVDCETDLTVEIVTNARF